MTTTREREGKDGRHQTGGLDCWRRVWSYPCHCSPRGQVPRAGPCSRQPELSHPQISDIHLSGELPHSSNHPDSGSALWPIFRPMFSEMEISVMWPFFERERERERERVGGSGFSEIFAW